MSKSLVLHCDSKTIEALANNPKYHSKIKHIELDFTLSENILLRRSLQLNMYPALIS